MNPLISSVSRVTTALANVSSVFQLFSFLVVCSNMISKGFGLVAFFASVIIPPFIYYNVPLLVPYLGKSQYSLLIYIAILLTYLVCNVQVICLTYDWLLMKLLLVSWRLSLVFSRVTIHNWNH